MPELEGVALECAVAERVMVWKRVDYDSPDDFTDLPCFHPFRYADGESVTVYREGATCGMGWSPLRSMDAAWQVVDAMSTKGFHFTLTTRRDGIYARFFQPEKFGEGKSNGGNPGEAICRAALAAVEGEKE